MSDPQRLLDEGGELEVAVLRAARDDVAPPHLQRRVHAALGLGAGIVAAGTVATTATAAATPAAKGAVTVAWIGAAKWIGVGIVAAAATAGTAVYVRTRPAETASQPAAVASAAHTATAAVHAPAAGAEIPVAAAPAPSASTPNPASAPAPTPTSISGSTSPPAATASDLTDELASLDAARAALDAGDTALALQQIDRHDRDFARGQLAPEALALRIEVYAKRGDRPKVEELAGAFLARYPNHTQARRVRSILESMTTGHNP
jgi:hypothetical protein